jgi:hypothetical protein
MTRNRREPDNDDAVQTRQYWTEKEGKRTGKDAHPQSSVPHQPRDASVEYALPLNGRSSRGENVLEEVEAQDLLEKKKSISSAFVHSVRLLSKKRETHLSDQSSRRRNSEPNPQSPNQPNHE